SRAFRRCRERAHRCSFLRWIAWRWRYGPARGNRRRFGSTARGPEGAPRYSWKRTKQMKRTFVTVLALLGCGAAPATAQDVAAGEQSFRKCSPCHQVGESARNLIGPALNGLPGRKSGTVENYNYSEANKNAAISWDEAAFLDYIKDPKEKIPGTK